MITPDTGMGDDSQDASATATVPADEISIDDVPPSQGDKVNFSIEGTVQSVDGEMATIQITAINGEALSSNDQDADEAGGPTGDNDGISGALSTRPTPRGIGNKAQLAKRGAVLRSKASKIDALGY